ncbi:esterase/lipase family protein [Streptomyces rubiginosohelvolus]|uniref:esterase/lipase family protein n=1 Tax=Streptomyces rubiginosohelvolus TaxID=67362 RepID=UPI0036613104
MEHLAADLVVVLPGILGTALSRGPRQIWGYRSVTRLDRLSDRLTQDLALPPQAFDDPEHGFNDGARPTGTLRTLGIIPGFLSVDGYDRLMAKLRKELTVLGPDSVIEFPYDWRQSNVFTAHRLKAVIEPLLLHRRRRFPNARLVFVAHSMGGLIARYYAECLDTEKLTRRIITIGTPFMGAVKALAVLANGYASLGPRRFPLGDLVRSLPSVAELLPAYACVGPSPDALRPLSDSAVPGLPAVCEQRAQRFHQQMRAAIEANGDERPSYHALVSCRQKTATWASVADGRDAVLLHSPESLFQRGDGTVPRCSATPPEWEDDAASVFVSGRHASLQQQRHVLLQVHGIATAQPRRPMATMDEIAVEAEPWVAPGEEWTVRAESVEGSNGLVLTATVADPSTGEVIAQAPVRPRGDGTYTASLRLDRPGAFRWTVHTVPTGATPVEPVSDALLCVDA